MGILKKIDHFIQLKGSGNIHNKDLVPIDTGRRLWGYTGFLGYWGICVLCITTWSSGSSLLSLGLNGNQAMGVVVVANFFISVAAVLNSGYATEYHIGFSVYQRMVFGIRGSVFGVLIRAILSCVWFASQAWLGGLCVNVVLCSWSKSYLEWGNTLPESVHMTSQELCGFIIYLVISLPFIMIHPEFLDNMVALGAACVFVSGLGIAIWAVKDNDGHYGSLMSEKMALSSSQLGWQWMYGISIWYSSLTAGISNQGDFSRYTKSPWCSRLGILLGCNLFGFIVPLWGILSASALQEKYGELYWMPNEICLLWLTNNYNAKARAGAFFCGVGFILSQLAINCIGNAISGGMDLASIFPRYINIRRGAFIIFILCWPTQPWLFYNTSSVFVTVMSSFSVFITPLIGILMCDFYFVRKSVLKLTDCYNNSSSSIYWYWNGINFRGFVAFFVGVAPGLPGLINAVTPSISVSSGIRNFYYGSYIFQFVLAAIVYYLISSVFFKINIGERETVDFYNCYTDKECEKMGLIPHNSEVVSAAEEIEIEVESKKT